MTRCRLDETLTKQKPAAQDLLVFVDPSADDGEEKTRWMEGGKKKKKKNRWENIAYAF